MRVLYRSLTLVAIAVCVLSGTTASASVPGSITGTATDANNGLPIAGLSVCAEENILGGGSSGCTTTDTAGRYTIVNLPAGGNYQVEFSAPEHAMYPVDSSALGDLNYLTQYWRNRESLDNWDSVSVFEGLTTGGIDAAMKPGAQISGHVSDKRTRRALAGVRVCALDPAPGPRAEEFERCAFTDLAGTYTIRSLSAGTYVVVFARFLNDGKAGAYDQKYYPGVTFISEAIPISVSPPDTLTDINSVLGDRNTWIRLCPKHRRAKWVNGKLRCVKVHRKRHHRHVRRPK
jgi:hypothetical protein